MKQDFKTLWKNLANTKKITAANQAQYCILKAIASKSEDKFEIAKHFLRKAFTPVSRAIEIANGRVPFDTIFMFGNKADQFVYQPSLNGSKTRCMIILGVPAVDLLDEDEQKMFNEIIYALSASKLTRYYSYFFTRQDLFKEYQLVQTAHAALELGNQLNADQVKDLHFTCCGVENLYELENVERILQTLRVKYVVFTEPDIGHQKTAIGVYPIAEHKRGLLRKYKLLRFAKEEIKEDSSRELEVV